MSSKPPHAERRTVDGPAGALQSLIEIPQALSGPPAHFAVVCHPHPLYGGTMDNKVVYTLARTFEELGAPAIRFNFRGVEASSGQYDDGRGELEDTLAVVEYGRARWPQAQLWLAGFSFGAAVAVCAAARAAPQRLVAVAPAVARLGRLDVSEIRQRRCPWLIVQADADEVLDAQAVLQWARGVSPTPTVRVLAGASHFLHGRLPELRQLVLTFLQADAPS
ncbi:MAG TPA: alpha/beta fold hydrolase [Steroidobacteraceae bacterium]